MAYVRIDKIKDKDHLERLVEYMTNNDKTDELRLVDSYKCSPQYAASDFAVTRSKQTIKKGNNLAWHIKQSFSPDDKITAEQALEIGKELMRKFYPDFEYVIATHIDREHIHNHICINAVSYKTLKKLHSNKYTLEELRRVSDELCKENNLSIIESKKSHRDKLKDDIDKAVMQAENYNDFIAIMQRLGYLIKLGKYISFKSEDMKMFIRSSSLGEDYSLPILQYRIEKKIEPKGIRRTVYSDKEKYNSMRHELRVYFNKSLELSSNYDEFIENMRKFGYTAKEGKHLAFIGRGQKKYIRSESLGNFREEFSREGIIYQLKHKNEPIKLKKYIEDKGKLHLNSWRKAYNAQALVDSENFAIQVIYKEYGIRLRQGELPKAYSLLKSIAASAEKEYAADKDAVSHLEKEITTKEQILKAIDTYEENKQLVDFFISKGIKNLTADEDKQFRSCYGKYKYAEQVINKAQNDGFDIQKENIQTDIEKLKTKLIKLKDSAIESCFTAERYKTALYNFEHSSEAIKRTIVRKNIEIAK